MSKEQFQKLADQWKNDTINLSNVRKIFEHPAYQAIIAMGAEALPYIFEALQEETDHWFHALTLITGESPVPGGRCGHMQEMADAWIAWGISRGFIKK
jgi:hypothetical protein